MDFRIKIAEILEKETKLEKQEILSLLEIPPDSKLGDYSFPCFSLSKHFKKAPNLIAEELKHKIHTDIKSHEFLEEVRDINGYLNFFINKKLFVENVLKEIFEKRKDYGKSENKKQKVMIEFAQANTHKEFHIGHLRNTVLGQSVSNIFSSQGYEVINANYPGDIGAHVVKCIWCYLKFHKDDEIPRNRGKYLGKIYTESVKLCEENEEYKKEVSKILQKLEEGDEKLTELWKETRKWSLDEFHRIFEELGVKFDVWFFESEVEKEGKDIVNDLIKKGMANESEGAIIVDLNEYGLDVFLVLKSDGTSLYSTKDLALAIKKFNEYNIDQSIYVVDSRQKTYFKQLFKTLELMGFHKIMYHLPYEMVTLTEGTMSSRAGNVVLYEDFRDKLYEHALKETSARHPDWDEKRVNESSKNISFAAMKFDMLKYDNNRVIVFDIEKALDFEGETGPYVQYAHARINSILKKYTQEHHKMMERFEKMIDEVDFSVLNTEQELKLIRLLDKYPQILEESCNNYKPSVLSRYLLDLSQSFNEFYHACPILQEKEEIMNARLILVFDVKEVLRNGLNLLGINAPEEM